MRKVLSVLSGFAFMFGTAFAQDAEKPRYTNDEGEEVFGPDYMPRSPDDVGVPLYMGRPNAGFRIPDSMLVIPQDVFRNSTIQGSLPLDAVPRQLPDDVPYLKDFRERFNTTPLKFNNLVPNNTIGPSATMKVHYVDVGQGAGAIIELPCGVAVIDLGGEWVGGNGGKVFVQYLEAFLAARPHYNHTVNVVIVSHPHADHLKGTKSLMDTNIRVLGVVDNGQTGDEGSLLTQTTFREWVEQGVPKRYSAIEVPRQVTATGVTNSVIDPFVCADVTAFWGGNNDNASKKPYDNPNNHSVVVRIDFGEASFMFMGDLELEASHDMFKQYDLNPKVFDADVLLVPHHASENATNDDLIGKITPEIAIIQMGSRTSEGAKDYSHPRGKVIALLQDQPEIVSDKRTDTPKFWAYPSGGAPLKEIQIKQAIYGTGWEGTIVVTATAKGTYQIESLGH